MDGGQHGALPDWGDRPLEVHVGGKSTLLLEEVGRRAVSSNDHGGTDADSKSRPVSIDPDRTPVK